MRGAEPVDQYAEVEKAKQHVHHITRIRETTFDPLVMLDLVAKKGCWIGYAAGSQRVDGKSCESDRASEI